MSTVTLDGKTYVNGMTDGVCKVCGNQTRVDCCCYCNACYPYDRACDDAQYLKESRKMWQHGGGER